MNHAQVTYLVFGIVLIIALVFDLGLLSKKSAKVTNKQALYQTIFWVTLAMGFSVFLWLEEGSKTAIEYVSAYLMEWSLSIDNIFVFILIFSFFHIKERYYARVLLIGILMAIILRILFISAGIQLIQRFEWLLYIFGALLLYTGIKMFTTKGGEAKEEVEHNKIYQLLKRFLPMVPHDGGGKFTIKKDGKRYYTSIFVVVVMLASTDIVFALDSIPAVFAISQRPLVVYTSNIFAVLGLRSLFFLLKGAVNKFKYLQQGIAIVLIFIGLKMLAEMEFINIHIPVYISLLVILICIAASIIYSMQVANKEVQGEDIGTN